uniref:Band 7 domain-containing protein n=1 Tax=Chloropicon primus TaxID=1764295 RepID=A0A7S2WXF5_9CHLO|mmetsp:Transcript_13214/g.37057  ORF Transcript_13214/g.37057 Transcript_13214/m.37057 type:complete len:409 (+) Transcript_13214:160-1386(+)
MAMAGGSCSSRQSRRRSSRRRSRSPDVGAMGKLFRDASRGVRYAYIGKTTVKAGESALLFTLGGKSRVVEGPRRLRVFCTTIRFLDRFVANTHEYLRIQMRSGEISHMRGPCTMYLNPCVHESVDVLSAEKLADKEAIVVYSSDSAKASTVSRRVVVGPQLFVPDPHEWLHEFAWTSGAAEAGMEESRTVVSLRREVLRASVQSAQTASGDSVSLDLELTYQLDASAVAVVLDQTCDPVAELSAALKSDALAACKSMCVKDAVGATNPLGNLDIYKQTKALAAQLGFSLQGLRCSASDTASAKTEAEARKANAAIEHSRRMAEQRLAEEEIKLQSETRSSEQRRELRRKEHEFEMSITKQRTDQEIEKLTKLRELGVDLTAFLTAQRGECISNTARRMHSNRTQFQQP